MTSTSVSSGISLIAGKQIVSRQLIDQSGVPFDRIILGDLAAEYAKQLDIQVLAGTGANSQLNGLDHAAGNTVTYTTATALVVSTTTAASLLLAAGLGINKIQANRFLAPTAIVMHPRRWKWLLVALDTSQPTAAAAVGPSFNAIGSARSPRARGIRRYGAGRYVFVDPNVSTTANSTTNQDETFVLRASDSWLYESANRGGRLRSDRRPTRRPSCSALSGTSPSSTGIPSRSAKIVGTGWSIQV